MFGAARQTVVGNGNDTGQHVFHIAGNGDFLDRVGDLTVLDPETGRAFLENILEQGGSRKAMDLFVAFRGREPSIDALLRHSGLAEAA